MEVHKIDTTKVPTGQPDTKPQTKVTRKDSEDSEFNRFIDASVKSLNKADGNPTKMVNEMNTICNRLIEFNDETLTNFALEYICGETNLKLPALRSHLKRLSEAIIKGDGGDANTPEIVVIENWINEHYDIYYNTVSNLLMGKRKFVDTYEEININNMLRHLRKSHYDYSKQKLNELLMSDFVEQRNPIAKFFEELPPWDGVDRFDELADHIAFAQHIGDSIDHRKRFAHHLRKHFIRSIACAYGVDFNKHAILFVDQQQSSGKTSLTRWMCPPGLEEYMCENPLNSNDGKDSLIALSNNFWCILDEYGKMRQDEQNWYKSAMSKDLIKVRIPYAATPITTKRIANFVGSTNETDFLDDPTGSVRWICFELQSCKDKFAIDFAYREHINPRDLWIQAYAMYKDGTEYKLTREELLENEFINGQFKAVSPEMAYVAKHYTPGQPDDGVFMTTGDIYNELMKNEDIPLEVRRKMHSTNVGRALTTFKFFRTSRYDKELNYSVKGYFVKKRL